MLNKKLKNVAVIGCSYTNWRDGDCLLQSYPALIANDFPEYNVIDLSICGDSNSTVYYKIKQAEKQLKIKFDKIIWQITHVWRMCYFNQEYLKYNPFDFLKKKNYIYTFGEYQGNFTQKQMVPLQPWMLGSTELSKGSWAKEVMKNIKMNFGLDEKSIFSIIENYHNHWHLQETVDLLNAVYGTDNVLMFSWHNHNELNTISFENNYIGTAQEWVGDKFFEIGVDNAPHYNDAGHRLIYKNIYPDVNRLLT